MNESSSADTAWSLSGSGYRFKNTDALAAGPLLVGMLDRIQQVAPFDNKDVFG